MRSQQEFFSPRHRALGHSTHSVEPLWAGAIPGRVSGDLVFAERTLTVELAERFHALSHISLAELRAQVRACLVAAETVLLSDVLHRYPPREGILEVAGYLILAAQDSHWLCRPRPALRYRDRRDE